MHLARTSISTLPKPKHNALVLSRPEPTHFTLATDGGFELWQLYPLRFVLRRDLPGSLGHASAYGRSSLFFLVGGGPTPVFSPNKVVLWDESRAAAVVELEFRERVLGVESRLGLLAVALLRRVVLFEIGEAAAASPEAAGTATDVTSGLADRWTSKGKERAMIEKPRSLRRIAEWPTVDNPLGLIAMASAPGSSLLAIPGRQAGHVHLLHIHPAPSAASSSSTKPATPVALPPARSQILIAHTTALSTLTCSPSGALVSTTSTRGTLVRVFSGRSGALERELRRGADKAVLRQGGVAFGGGTKAEWLAVWSDKGTLHAFSLDNAPGSSGAGSGGRGASGGGGGGSAGKEADDKSRNRPSTLSKLLPYLPSPLALPKYFLSEWAHATYTLPTGDRHSMTLASLGSTLARGAAAAASAASGNGASPSGSPRVGGERDRLAIDEEDEDEDEHCVLAWVEVDVEREQARLRASKHGPAHARRATQAKVHVKRRQRGKDDSGSDDRDGGVMADRALHPSSLPRPAPPVVISSGSAGVRARAAGALHTSHRRDIEPTVGRRPHLPAAVGSGSGTGGGSSGFRTHHDRPSAPHRVSSATSGGPTAGSAGRQTESQLVALTFSGGFYRLALPSSTLAGSESLTAGGSSSEGGARTGSDDDEERHTTGLGGARTSHDRRTASGSGAKAGGLALAEYRRFGAGGWAFALGPGEDGRPWNELGEW